MSTNKNNDNNKSDAAACSEGDYERRYRDMCQDWAEDDTFVEELCRLNGVEELAITGDSYGVPPLTDKVATLVQKLGGNVPDDYEFYPTPNM